MVNGFSPAEEEPLEGVENEQYETNTRGIVEIEAELTRKNCRIRLVGVERYEGFGNLKEEAEGKEIGEEKQELSRAFHLDRHSSESAAAIA